MWRVNGPIGGSQQYLTRTAVTPAGTSNGSSTKLPCCSELNSPVKTWFGSIAAPPQEVGTQHRRRRLHRDRVRARRGGQDQACENRRERRRQAQ